MDCGDVWYIAKIPLVAMLGPCDAQGWVGFHAHSSMCIPQAARAGVQRTAFNVLAAHPGSLFSSLLFVLVLPFPYCRAPIAATVAKDTTLAQPLRDPALVLVAAILCADAAALVSTVSGQEDIYTTLADTSSDATTVHPETGKNGGPRERETGSRDAPTKECTSKEGGSKAPGAPGHGPSFDFESLCRVAAIESVGWKCCTQVWTDILERSSPGQLPPQLLARILWVGGQLSLVSADLDREEGRQGEAGGTPTKALPRTPSFARQETCSAKLAVLLRR